MEQECSHSDKHCHQKTRRITNPEAIREAECSALPLLNSGFQIHGYGLFCWIMGLHIYIQIILRVPTPVLPMTTPPPSYQTPLLCPTHPGQFKHWAGLKATLFLI